MPKKVSRRSFLRKVVGSLLTLAGTGYGGYFYAHQIEPRLLKVNSYTIKHYDIPKSFNGFKIVQFSDTHLGFQYDLLQFKKMLRVIKNLEPDIIFFTGDLMDAPNQFPNPEEIIPLLKDLDAPFGKFAIYGNHDHGGYGSNLYKNIMEHSKFNILLNDSFEVKLLDHNSIYIIGLDDAMLGKPNFDIALENVPDEKFKILLSHAPDLADKAVEYGVQLQLSGHSHGGQIQIPFIGALITPPYARKYREGFYNIDKLKLYVNRGIGTTRLPFRFMSKPEIAVFTLQSLK